MREFDLNIERVLENWTVAHALREVIANALDEQALTGSREPQIFLKDALATFDRHRIAVVIKSRHGDITTGKQAKHGFDDIQTLHALITDPSDPGFIGTEFIMHGTALGERQVEEAKALFLRYSGDEELGVTPFGTVLRRKDNRGRARIYVNGLRVAEEENFLFSYNITSPTAALRRALNRERSNVGRSAYTDRVKSTMLACTPASSSTPAVRSSSLRRSSLPTPPTSCGEQGTTDTSSSSCPRRSVGSCRACATRSATRCATWTATAASGRTAFALPSSTQATSTTPNAQYGRHSRGSSKRGAADRGTSQMCAFPRPCA